ncbi:MAG: zinc ribbon domain-containing protein [Planctomycetota bacterium]|nr:MAG: zinc ribbon domain-containing protein [Planctomycetota bacterium]
MPHYDYQCQACGHEYELFQRMSEPVLQDCPECTKPKLKRLVGGGGGVVFRGSGFYVTDYKRKQESTPPCGQGGCAQGACPAPQE